MGFSLHERDGARNVSGHRRPGPRVAVLHLAQEPEHDESRADSDQGDPWTTEWTAPTRPASALRRRLVGVDVIALFAGWTAGSSLAGHGGDGALLALLTGVGTIVVGVVASVICLSTFGLYRPPLNGIRSGALGRVVQGLALGALVVVGWQALMDDVVPGAVLGGATGALMATLLARYGFDVWLIGRREQGDFRTAVVVAGAANETTTLVEFLELNPEAGFHATAIVGERPVLDTEATDVAPWLGGLDRARAVVDRTGAAGVLVGVNGLPSDTVNELVHSLSLAGIPVHLSTGLTGVSRARLRTFPLAHEPIVMVRPPRHSAAQEVAKRALDIGLAAGLLVLTAPLIAVAAVLIKAHDRGPALFRQVRVGRDGKLFTLIKLRTMTVDAEDRLGDLRQSNERHGPLFKVSDDPRVTPIGGFLRSSAIDELPQLFNVLAGTMSIVGPRPALPVETADFDDELQRRHRVRPGVTGLWQVEANHKASFEEYRRLDLFYVDNWSVGMDLAIAIDTVPALGRRALRALRQPAPSTPAAVTSPAPMPTPVELG